METNEYFSLSEVCFHVTQTVVWVGRSWSSGWKAKTTRMVTPVREKIRFSTSGSVKFWATEIWGAVWKQTYYQLNLGIVKPDKSGPAGDISYRTEPCLNNPPCNLCVCLSASVCVCLCVHVLQWQTEKEELCVGLSVFGGTREQKQPSIIFILPPGPALTNQDESGGS